MTYPTRLRGLVAALAAITLASTAAAQGLPSPEERFGHRREPDRRLVSYDEFPPYL